MRRWSKWLAALSGLAIVLGLAGVFAFTFAISWAPARHDFAYQGIDVSAANGPVEWAVVRGGGADFGYVTATIGADARDAAFEDNWRDIYAAGLRRGALHVYSLCRLAADQANNFNTTVPRTNDALPPAVTIDFDPACEARPARQVVIGELIRFLTMIETHTGKPALLKISKRFDTAYRLSPAVRRPLWSVQNFFPPEYGARPWRMWQANDMRRIDGVQGYVHWNVVAP